MLEKPAILKIEEEINPEQKLKKLAILTLEREMTIKEPERARGFMLSTLIALGLSLGLMASGAEAQQRWKPSAGRQVFTSILSESGSAITRAKNDKNVKIEHEYIANLNELRQTESALDREYSIEKNRLNKIGDHQGLENLENNYKQAKIRIEQDKVYLKKEHNEMIRKIKISGAIASGVVRGVRGW